MPSVCLFLLAHDASTLQQARQFHARYPWIHPLWIPNTKYMESIAFAILRDPAMPYRAIWDNDAVHFVGLLKPSFTEKYPFYNFDHLCSTEAPFWDLWTFVNGHEDNYRVPNPSMLTYAGICHTLFPVLWYRWTRLLQIPLEQAFSPEIPAYYSNAWIAKKHVFQGYIDFFKEAMHHLETDEELNGLAHYNANYLQRLPVERLKEIMHLPYYTYHCFLCERLPCLYFWTQHCRHRRVGGPHRRPASEPEPGLPCLPLPD